MRFPYALMGSPRPLWPLRGRLVRPRTIVYLGIVGPSGQAVGVDGLVDTGADDTVFPDRVAAAIGLDLTGAPVGTGGGLGALSIPIRYAQANLRLTDGREFREWRARVGFAPPPFHRTLPGFAGFLEYFTATFHGDREEVDLAVNALYPGT